MTAQCWRFTGENVRDSDAENLNYEYFACGEQGSYLIDGTNAFLQIDGDFVQDQEAGGNLVFFTGTQLVGVSPNGMVSTNGFYSIGNCDACSSKYDNLNGECISQATYGTPGKYLSLQECQAAPSESSVSIISISVPVFSNCDVNGNPVNIQQNVSVIKGIEDCELLRFQQLADIQGELNCNINCVAAVPDAWLIPPEFHRPQVIYQFAEINASNVIVGPPMYPITVPHHIADKPTTPLPNYQRGNWESIYVLKDNSKVTIHTLDKANADIVLNAIKKRIISDYLVNAYLSKSCEVVTDTPLKQITVKNRMGKYYATGSKKNLPDWIVTGV